MADLPVEKLSHCRKWAPGLTKDPALQGTDCSEARAEAFTFSWLLREIYVRSKNKFVNIHNRIRHDLILQRETQQIFLYVTQCFKTTGMTPNDSKTRLPNAPNILS